MAKKNHKINSVLERGLLIIDETPLKTESANITKKLLSNIKAHEEKIKKFSTQDVELYEAWFRSIFSNLTEKIQDMHRKYQDLAIRWNKILAISDMNKISTEEAYLQNLSEEEILKSGTEKEKEELKKLNQKRDSWIDNKIEEECSNEFKNDEDEYFEDDDEDLLEDLEEAKKFILLSRKLHPDHCNIKEANYNWNELWSQVQVAYNNKDTQKLYEIYYLTEYWSDKLALSLSEYKTLNTYLEDEITRLKNESAHMNKHPAWGFSKKKSFVGLEKKIKKDLNQALDEISEKVGELDHRFWYLAISSRNFKKSVSKSKKRTKSLVNQKRRHKNFDFDDELFSPF